MCSRVRAPCVCAARARACVCVCVCARACMPVRVFLCVFVVMYSHHCHEVQAMCECTKPYSHLLSTIVMTCSAIYNLVLVNVIHLVIHPHRNYFFLVSMF